jgi:linoleoyl-CoA desaturase
MERTAKRFTFSNQMDNEFFTTLRARVNDYFKTNKITKHGDSRIIIKSIVMFLIYFIPYGLMITGVVTMPLLFLGLWILMGLGAVGIGVNIMHDANHGSFSKNKKLNNVLGRCLNLIGGNARTWKIQHNVLHHAYTNIEGMDHDIAVPNILRFSPHQKKRWFHRFQHIYAWFLYGLQTFARAFVTDFTNAVKFWRTGVIKKRSEYKRVLSSIVIWKLVYFTYILVLPLIFMPVSPWLILAGFACMHVTAGLLMAIIFQSAHVMPDCEFPLPNKQGNIENNWAVHQLQTTTNFAPNSRFLTWLLGGLNFQIEHHLFSNICHTHYREISNIVKDTAHEFGIQYNIQKSFFRAIWEHGRMLKHLGSA